MEPLRVLENVERMESINFKEITKEIVTVLSNIPLERKTGRWHGSHLTKIHFTPDMVRSMLIFGVWKKSLDLLNGDEKKSEPLAVEKALAILMKKGVEKDRIQFRENSFRVQLNNSRYRIYKLDEKGVHACPWPMEEGYRTYVPSAHLASFLMRFDEEIPSIVSHVTTVMETIRARELEETKRMMEKGIKDELVRSLIDQYLKPLGLSAEYNVGAGDIVSLDLRKVMSAHIEVPLDRLADMVKDTEGIVDSLVTEEPKVKKGCDEDDFDDDFINYRPNFAIIR